MKSLAEYLYQCLKLPVIALILAVGAVMAADPFLEFSLIEKILIFAGIFTVLITVKNHFAQAKLVAEMRRHLDGISEFEHDIAKRLEDVSAHRDGGEFLTSVSERMDGLEQKFNSSLKKSADGPGTNMHPVNENIPLKNLLLSPEIIAASNSSDRTDEFEEHVNDGELQLYLQPVLTLPEREVTHYEAFARFDLGDGRSIKCSDFINEAEQTGAIVELDRQMLHKIVQLLRDLRRDDVAPGIFWNLSATSLDDEDFFNDILEILKANPVICPQILVEISQEKYQKLGLSKLRMLSSLRDLGVGLSIDNCDNLALLQRLIKSSAFSFIKIPITTLVGYEGENHELNGVQIAHQAHKNQTNLIATHVEKEIQVMELIDQDILMAQGDLFSEPRPAKSRDDSPTPDVDSIATT
ncbi:MAG: EAL domain-containing protein [Rhizobiaceae bacterium]|nr:EAL domain-containing protein [Rhizobiaceae bacterium]